MEEPSTSGSSGGQNKPVVVLVIGMAGSGKTTLIQRINAHMHMKKMNGYIINLDPAVTHLLYGANIDIRDTVNYKNVMKQYGLGPNGGILTSCNLFATRFDQVIGLCEKPRDPPLEYIVVDTPGQIEIFTWSASGQLITELFASGFPTCVVYVVDTPRCTAPQTFMSNMLQAVSILYKTKLPLLLAFNKVDVARHQFALEWMSDFEVYSTALEADSSYAATLSRSLSLVLEEFYAGIKTCGVSALTGEGMEELFECVHACAEDYQKYYVPEMEAKRAKRQQQEAERQAGDITRLQRDLAAASLGTAGGAGTSSSSAAGREAAAGPSSQGQAQEQGTAGAGTGNGHHQQQQPQQQQQQGEEDEEGSADLQLSDESIEYSEGRGMEDD